jgi:hypothetical protein
MKSAQESRFDYVFRRTLQICGAASMGVLFGVALAHGLPVREVIIPFFAGPGLLWLLTEPI